MLIEEQLPDWRDKFLSYKELKKQLKLVHPKEGDDGSKERENKRPRLSEEEAEEVDGGCDDDEAVTKEVIDFFRLLENDIDKFNLFFLDKEERYVIKWKELQNRVTKAGGSNEELMSVGSEIVDFHGEMVLLENYSALNYTGLVKILKKYDKRSGALIRLPFIQKVLQEPFFTTDVLDKLVKECETMLEHLFSINQPSNSHTDEKTTAQDPQSSTEEDKGRIIRVPKELADIEHMESMYTKLTLSALRILKEIRSKSSTLSVFSLPPLQSNSVEEAWKKVSILEEAAK
jgi:SPX domain protein involved in polyphosphate accumulation